MSQVRPTTPRIRYFEDALSETGWGLYYKFLVGFSSVNMFTNGVVLLTMYFSIPLAACDLNLHYSQVTGIHISYILGRALGGCILCGIADNVGKRCMIPKSSVIIFISCFLSAFSHNAYLLYISAFCLGSGVQTSYFTTQIYLAEILPVDRRGPYLILPELFWTMGYFTVSALLFPLTSSLPVEDHVIDMRLTSWRIIFAIAGGLSITMACVSALLEIGPRYLLFKKRFATSAQVLKQFYAINKSKYSETFRIYGHSLHNVIQDYQISNEFVPDMTWTQIKSMMKVMSQMMFVLTFRKFLLTFISITLMRIPGMIGIASVIILLSRRIYNADSVSMIRGYDFLNVTSVSWSSECHASIHRGLFQTFLVLSTCLVLGQLLTFFTINRIGRKIVICVGLAFISISNITLALSQNFTINLTATCFLIVFYNVVDITLNVLTIECFPTGVRGTAVTHTCFYGLILSCFVYGLINVRAEIYFMLLGALTFGAFLIGVFCIREMKGRPMVE